jgi:hypothetical protein
VAAAVAGISLLGGKKKKPRQPQQQGPNQPNGGKP